MGKTFKDSKKSKQERTPNRKPKMDPYKKSTKKIKDEY